MPARCHGEGLRAVSRAAARSPVQACSQQCAQRDAAQSSLSRTACGFERVRGGGDRLREATEPARAVASPSSMYGTRWCCPVAAPPRMPRVRCRTADGAGRGSPPPSRGSTAASRQRPSSPSGIASTRAAGLVEPGEHLRCPAGAPVAGQHARREGFGQQPAGRPSARHLQRLQRPLQPGSNRPDQVAGGQLQRQHPGRSARPVGHRSSSRRNIARACRADRAGARPARRTPRRHPRLQRLCGQQADDLAQRVAALGNRPLTPSALARRPSSPSRSPADRLAVREEPQGRAPASAPPRPAPSASTRQPRR